MNNNPSRLQTGKKCSLTGIVLNIFLFVIKLTASLISGSLAAITDAFNNLTDASSSIISLIGFRMSEKSADDEHPYGHARAEYLSALIVAMVILILGFEFIKTALKEIISPAPITVSPALFVIMAISVCVKTGMAFYNYRTGKSINSKTLIATGDDSRNDAIVTTGVIAGYIISYFTDVSVDGYVSLVIALFIFINGIMLIKSTMDPLLGQAPSKELVEYIRTKIISQPSVLGAHDLIVHDYGVGRRFASVHVEMSAELDVMKSHDIIDAIEQDFLKNDNINMIIHMDPIGSEDMSLRLTVNTIAKKIHPECTIHDLKSTDNEIFFDCVKPTGCPLSDDSLVAAFDVALRMINPEYVVHVTVDAGFSPIIN